MYKVTVNVDPSLIGHGELMSIITNVVYEKIIATALDNPHKSLVKVEYVEEKEITHDSRIV